MAPIKFEEHIKEKLDRREIQPSAGSWDKLNSRLASSEKKSGNKWWISAAAAVMVILIASLLFVNQQGTITNTIVETPVEEKIQESTDNNDFQQPVQVASEENIEVKDERIKEPEAYKSDSQNSEELVVENQNSETVLKSEEVNQASQPKREFLEPSEIRQSAIAETETAELYTKVKEVLAKIAEGEKSSENYSKAEVDVLLAEAARELSKDQNLYSAGIVSADALLADVEYEVDQSFRKEVFDFLKEEFLKAKTAVATRND